MSSAGLRNSKDKETGIACEDIEASLTGKIFDNQDIEGTDSINIVEWP